ncbi:uncharacterized protein JCM6883_003985 [Sporobolomyces salmoneus]|uniref:uncharacterized protein n=1 Tax=Sporobolomyces salmoneus TaxID=183962 RepID=UPI0031779819
MSNHSKITPLITSSPPSTPTRSPRRTPTSSTPPYVYPPSRSSTYPPNSNRDDHIIEISSLPPSPRTPVTRSNAQSRRTVEQTRNGNGTPRSEASSPRSPRRSTASTSPSRRAHSTSIDFSFNTLDPPLPSTREEAEEPLLPSTSRSRSASTQIRTKQKRTGGGGTSKMRWTVFLSTTAITVMVYLSWKIMLRGEEGQEKGKEWKDEMMNLISTRFEKQRPLNETFEAAREDSGAMREEEDIQELGRDGNLVRMENGEEFVYRNSFGGTFLKSKTNTSLRAQAQNDVPSLAEEWDFETMTISGVNLGGWLTLEPFITPAYFEPFLNSTTPGPAVDEYTLSQNLLNQGGEDHLFQVLNNHYETFITEKDFAEIAGAGLNWVRIPLPFWSISKWENEPFLERTSWKYFLKALEWSRKYGLRVNLDLHSVPGSQNGWNHSGKWGSINWLHSSMGLANAQRSLDYIGTLAEFISRPEVAEVVKMFSLLNEPMMNVIGAEPLRSFYAKAYRTIRAQTSYGSGPMIAIHDGFKGTRRWYDFASSPQFRDFPVYSSSAVDAIRTNGTASTSSLEQGKFKMAGGLDRVAIDSHRYLAFSEPDTRSVREQILKPCQKWAPEFNKTFNGFGVPIAGEFSIAPNDCGLFLNNVNQGTRLEGTFLNEATGQPVYNASVEEGSCAFWEDYESWSTELKDDLRDLAYAQMDTFQNWFYWTWKTSPSLAHPDRFANPLWSYSLGLSLGWIPRNPRHSRNFCYSYAEHSRSLSSMPRRRLRKAPGEMEGWKIGRYQSESQREIPSEQESDQGRYPWPPPYFNLDPMSAAASFDEENPKLPVDTLPRYQRTAKPVVLPGLPTTTALNTTRGLKDRYAPIEGCEYPDTWGLGNKTAGWNERCLEGS